MYLPQIPTIGHKHPLELIDGLIPLAPRTETGTLTKRTQIAGIDLLIILTDTIPTVLPQAHILIPYITSLNYLSSYSSCTPASSSYSGSCSRATRLTHRPGSCRRRGPGCSSLRSGSCRGSAGILGRAACSGGRFRGLRRATWLTRILFGFCALAKRGRCFYRGFWCSGAVINARIRRTGLSIERTLWEMWV
jgi:hypothetical protein